MNNSLICVLILFSICLQSLACNNPLQTNLNKYAPRQSVREEKDFDNIKFCASLNGKTQCCEKKSIDAIENIYES